MRRGASEDIVDVGLVEVSGGIPALHSTKKTTKYFKDSRLHSELFCISHLPSPGDFAGDPNSPLQEMTLRTPREESGRSEISQR